MSRRTKDCLALFLSAMAFYAALMTDTGAAPSQRDIERNQINGGNDSINVIATGGSKVLVFRENERKIRVLAADVVRTIRKNNPKLFAEARQTIPEQSLRLVEDLALANYVFEKGQYSLSASLFEEIVSKFKKEDVGYNAVEGMVNASYFGSGRHVQGLRFICRQYASRPSWSFRFRHDIHAHLRALTAKFGHDYARDVLQNIRQDKRCRRSDFSEVWIPIHLHDMRALEQSSLPEHTPYGFSTAKDIAFAKRLMREQNHGFIDYLYFIDGDYDEIIHKFPDSYLYDLALLGKGAAAEGIEAIDALETFIDRYKDSNHRAYAVKLVLRKATKSRNKAEVNRILDKYEQLLFNELSQPGPRLSAEEVIALDRFQHECVQFRERFEKLNFRPIASALVEFDHLFSQIYGPDYRKRIYGRGIEGWNHTCGIGEIESRTVRSAVAILDSFDQAFSSGDLLFIENFGKRAKRCGDIREFLDEDQLSQEELEFCDVMLDVFGYSVSFHRLASNIFKYLYDYDEERFHYLLFLGALSNKHNDDFQTFLAMMQRYVFDHPSKAFADDALTEIGWYYLVIDRNPEKSDRFLMRVVDNYSQTNSFDNALNWLVISKRNQGDYKAAFGFATKLAAHVSSRRLVAKISGRYEKLRTISTRFDIERSKISVGTFWGEWDVWGVDPPSVIVRRSRLGFGSGLVEGSTIRRVNGIEIESSDDFYLLLNQMIVEGRSHIDVVFKQPDSWDWKEERIGVAAFGWIN